MTISVGRLKAVKNAAIGNPKTKAALAQDPVLLAALIDALRDPALAAEAAHVVASLALGADAALHALLVAHAPRALLFALAAHCEPHTRAAVARALRVVAASTADAVGPALWGLARTPARELLAAAAATCDGLCAPEALDIYLPLLATPSAAATAIAQLLGTLLRTPAQRTAVTNWTPSPASPEQTTRSRRGWEKTAAAATPVVPVVARWLVALLDAPGKNYKMDEAVLYALAALAQENPTVAGYLGQSDTLPLETIITLAKSRSAEVQVAACLCITHTLRSLPPRPPPSSHPHPRHSHSHSASTSYPHAHMPTIHSLVHAHVAGGGSAHAPPPTLEETGVRTVLNVVNRMLSGAPAESPLVRMRACFVLHYLVADDLQLCNGALDRGCLDGLGVLILALGPTEPAPPEWEEAEAGVTQALREVHFLISSRF
ncbi:hypothetical protein HYPSUDRAFT_203311 [Hypholoma sublateritium FD-334 SS-4]|uniref:Armadillo repeat-containing protein 8 n=1 Tax=Hypholoma sublateritium (strain FD-334 SS-4) TaxID=945553 RepID=A0A0D2NWN5_HYPSF|nr:hypothetical protein HYPSUDRAFT_203311 [Hypholoma sublateritium FD-334 SS-4]